MTVTFLKAYSQNKNCINWPIFCIKKIVCVSPLAYSKSKKEKIEEHKTKILDKIKKQE
jgi:hypothetical protein